MIVIATANEWWEVYKFPFCKFPKAFLAHPRYRKLSVGAMTLYTVLLDRMSLSASNDWRDKNGDVFIYYSNKELCEIFNWSHDTATKRLKELEEVGLVRRRKQRLGHPDAIYVQPFLTQSEFEALQSAENKQDGARGNGITECEYSATNKTESSNTDLSKTHLSISGYDEDAIRHIIQENIEYEILAEREMDMAELNEIVALMTDVCCGTSPTIHISGNDYPRDMVVGRFLHLDSGHIEYVMETMDHTTTDIRNIRAYLLTALFNAPVTYDYYWRQRVRHDMPELALG